MKVAIAIFLFFLKFSANCQALSDNKRDSTRMILFQKQEKSNRETINKPFPAFSFLDKGETINNDYFKGKTVFINFWFEACPPCMGEVDALNDLYNKLKDKTNFEFVSFTFEAPEKIEELKNKYQIHYRVLSIKREECYRLNNNNGFPTSIIIDSLGLIKYRVTGGNIDKNKAKESVTNEIYPEILKNL